MELVERMTVGAYRVLGRPGGTLETGAEADVTVFDPQSRFTVRASEFESKGRNTPFEGWDLPGRVLYTVVGGRIAYQTATSEATLR
jgi:dihydroorotase